MDFFIKLLVSGFLFWTGNIKTAEAVVYGVDAGAGEFPSVVAIWSSFESDNGTYYPGGCSGSIISSEWILTAAHCVVREGFHGNVTTGIYRLPFWYKSEHTPFAIEIERVIVHEKYLRGPSVFPISNDIALVKLARKLEWSDEVKPIGLARNDPFPPGSAVQAQIAGWASDTDPNYAINDYQYPRLQKANVTIFAYDMCHKELNGSIVSYYEKGSMECGRGQSASGCGGDSGTPLLIDGVQVGVLTGGDGNCREPFEFNYIPVYKYIEWIQRHCGDCLLKVDKAPEPVVLAKNPLTPHRNSSFSSSVAVLDTSFQVVCAGTVIGSRWILTTGNCVRRHQVAFISPWGVYGGHVKINGSHVPNDFEVGKPLNDIGLLELDSQGTWVEKKQKLKLDTAVLEPRSVAIHYGWSKLVKRYDDLNHAVPSETLVHVVFDQVCRKLYPSEDEFDAKSMFCGLELLEQGTYVTWDSEGDAVIRDGVVVGLKLGLVVTAAETGDEADGSSKVHASLFPNNWPTRFTRISKGYVEWIDGHCDCLEYLRPEPIKFWGWNGIAYNIFIFSGYVHAWFRRKELAGYCKMFKEFGQLLTNSAWAFLNCWLVASARWCRSKVRRAVRGVAAFGHVP